ncbi:MAG TPA: hypothetical protein PLN21_19310 [Gemmatales bacterium]|nr:hypothetical protein [Gemmatales bacterium]
MNKKFLLSVICIGMIASSLNFLMWQPLPAVSDIEGIQANFSKDGKRVSLGLPSQYWKSLWYTLLPARYDWNPAGWMIFGRLEIKLKDGSAYRVDLYNLGEGAGAFSAGPTFESRSYYRGGNSSKMIEVLSQAYQDTIQTKP